MTYRIESDVEPPEFTGKAWNTVYPWAQMHEGDSILVERAKAKSARSAATEFSTRHPGWKFTARNEGEALRIWCIQRPGVSIRSLPVRLVRRMGD